MIEFAHADRADPARAAKADLIPATLLASELRELTGDAGPGHRKVVQLAADGRVTPPLERHNGRWVCPRAKLPELAVLLGLIHSK